MKTDIVCKIKALTVVLLGLLVDNYLVVKAVLVREDLVDPESGFGAR